MNYTTHTAKMLASPLLILFAAAIPLSTTAGTVLGILLILVWILSGDFKKKITVIVHNPVAVAVLFYLFLHLLGLLWTEDLDWGLLVLQKQWKLLLLPILLTLAKTEHTKYYLSAFIAAIVIMACKAYLVWLGLISLPPGSIFTTSGTSHVTYNPMLALAIYVVGQNILFGKSGPAILWPKVFLFLFLSCNMFITVGRTGQAVFFVLLAVLLFQYCYPRSKKMLCLGIILLPLLIGTLFQYNSTFHNRITTAIDEIQDSPAMQITSLGCRLWFYKNTFLLLKEHWLVGAGTGDFPLEYAKINQQHSPEMPNTDNPHNQYFLISAQFGILGLISLLAIFVIQLLVAFRKDDSLRPIRQAFPIFFLVIMLAESYLQVFETGLLFSLFSSFLYKEIT